jgi:hypothetical protein
MSRFDQICNTIGTLNNKRDTRIKSDVAMAMPVLTYGSEIRIITKKKIGSKNLNCRD